MPWLRSLNFPVPARIIETRGYNGKTNVGFTPRDVFGQLHPKSRLPPPPVKVVEANTLALHQK
jgi:hypothetical protein